MAIELPNGKISRTLPEQVGFNSEKIYEIIKFLNESGLKDQVINLTSLSGTLTPEQYAIAELSPSYIVYEGTIFFKGVEDLTNIDYFELTPQIETDSSMLLNMSRIRIVRDTRAYSQSYVNLFESYNKTQLDSLLAAKANLSGANFTGAITAPSIIEDMTGYSAIINPANVLDHVFTNIYSGCVKNGNKLTFVSFVKVKRLTGATNSRMSICRFTIPLAVANKLYPYSISGYTNMLDIRKGVAVAGIGDLKDFTMFTTKTSTTTVDIAGILSVLTAEIDYLIRLEMTFLLSDNLISE